MFTQRVCYFFNTLQFPIPFTTTLVCMPLIYLLGANVLIAQRMLLFRFLNSSHHFDLTSDQRFVDTGSAVHDCRVPCYRPTFRPWAVDIGGACNGHYQESGRSSA